MIDLPGWIADLSFCGVVLFLAWWGDSWLITVCLITFCLAVLHTALTMGRTR